LSYIDPYPANVENMVSSQQCQQMGFNPYPANVENMVSF